MDRITAGLMDKYIIKEAAGDPGAALLKNIKDVAGQAWGGVKNMATGAKDWTVNTVKGIGKDISDTVEGIPAAIKEYPKNVVNTFREGASNWAKDPMGVIKNNPLGFGLAAAFPAYSAYSILKDPEARKDPGTWGRWAGTTAGSLMTVGVDPTRSAKTIFGTTGMIPQMGLSMMGMPEFLMGPGAVARWSMGNAGGAVGDKMRPMGQPTLSPESYQQQHRVFKIWDNMDPAMQNALLSYGRRMGYTDEKIREMVASQFDNQSNQASAQY